MRYLEKLTRNPNNKLYDSNGNRVKAELIGTIDMSSDSLKHLTENAPPEVEGYIVLKKTSKGRLVEFYRAIVYLSRRF